MFFKDFFENLLKEKWGEGEFFRFLFLRGFRVKQKHENLKEPYVLLILICPAILASPCFFFTCVICYIVLNFHPYLGRWSNLMSIFVSTGLISPPSFELDRMFSNFPEIFCEAALRSIVSRQQ